MSYIDMDWGSTGGGGGGMYQVVLFGRRLKDCRFLFGGGGVDGLKRRERNNKSNISQLTDHTLLLRAETDIPTDHIYLTSKSKSTHNLERQLV